MQIHSRSCWRSLRNASQVARPLYLALLRIWYHQMVLNVNIHKDIPLRSHLRLTAIIPNTGPCMMPIYPWTFNLSLTQTPPTWTKSGVDLKGLRMSSFLCGCLITWEAVLFLNWASKRLWCLPSTINVTNMLHHRYGDVMFLLCPVSQLCFRMLQILSFMLTNLFFYCCLYGTRSCLFWLMYSMMISRKSMSYYVWLTIVEWIPMLVLFSYYIWYVCVYCSEIQPSTRVK